MKAFSFAPSREFGGSSFRCFGRSRRRARRSRARAPRSAARPSPPPPRASASCRAARGRARRRSPRRSPSRYGRCPTSSGSTACPVDERRAEARAEAEEEHLAALEAAERLHGRVVDDLRRLAEGLLEVEAGPARAEVDGLGIDQPVAHGRRDPDRDHVVVPVGASARARRRPSAARSASAPSRSAAPRRSLESFTFTCEPPTSTPSTVRSPLTRSASQRIARGYVLAATSAVTTRNEIITVKSSQSHPPAEIPSSRSRMPCTS